MPILLVIIATILTTAHYMVRKRPVYEVFVKVNGETVPTRDILESIRIHGAFESFLRVRPDPVQVRDGRFMMNGRTFSLDSYRKDLHKVWPKDRECFVRTLFGITNLKVRIVDLSIVDDAWHWIVRITPSMME